MRTNRILDSGSIYKAVSKYQFIFIEVSSHGIEHMVLKKCRGDTSHPTTVQDKLHLMTHPLTRGTHQDEPKTNSCSQQRRGGKTKTTCYLCLCYEAWL